MKTVFCVLTFAAGLWGQSTVGRISGTVTDQSGAVVPGLTVTAQESSTGVRTPTVTQDNGSYVFTSLPPGSYTITVEKSGFTTIHQTGILLDAASSRTINLELKPGTVSESISVEANAEQVQTDSGDVTSTIDSRQVANISLNGRNYMQLLRLVPGTSSITLDAFSITSSSVAQSINGAHAANSASVTLDGVDNVDDSSGVSERSAPNPDSIAEVRVLTASYSAEFGKRADQGVAALGRGRQRERAQPQRRDRRRFRTVLESSGRPPAGGRGEWRRYADSRAQCQRRNFIICAAGMFMSVKRNWA